MSRGLSYSYKEIQELIACYNEGVSYKEMSRRFNRSEIALQQQICRLRRQGIIPSECKPQSVGGGKNDYVVGIIASGPQQGLPVLKMSPREMIKALYDLGYRIENNQLVVHTTQVVKIKDIIENG